MRALGLPSKILVAWAAAATIVIALGLPWYGAIPAAPAEYRIGDVSGPLDAVFAAIPRWLGERSGTTGWELAGVWDATFAAVAGVAALAAALALMPGAEQLGRRMLQLAAPACLGIAVLKVLDRPDGLEPRYGIFVAMAAAGVLVVTAQGIAAAPLRRRRAPAMRYAGPRAPRPVAHALSMAPPSRLSAAGRGVPGVAGTSGAASGDERGMRRM